MLEIVKNYRDNAVLRQSFDGLAGRTFGLTFEDWYRNGYWSDKYIPYSVAEEGRVIANVSVNRMDMRLDGEIRHLLQLGTVMTDEAYRNRGLIRRLMEEIEADYAGKADGMYLFANDSVLDFYPKFGYRRAEERQYRKAVEITAPSTVQRVPVTDSEERERLFQAIRRSRFCGRFDMADNAELFMFYVTKFMQETVYYVEEPAAWLIAETGEGKLLLHGVFSEQETDLAWVIRAFGSEIKEVVLGFTPEHAEGYALKPVQEEDCTLFVKGMFFRDFEEKKLMFPTLSHA